MSNDHLKGVAKDPSKDKRKAWKGKKCPQRAPKNNKIDTIQKISEDSRRAANEAGVALLEQPALANGRLELRLYLREQAISHTTHRYGNLPKQG